MFKGFLECHVGNQPLDHLLDLLHLQHPRAESAKGAQQPYFLLHLTEQEFRGEDFAQFLVVVGTKQAADNGTAARAGHDRRQQTLLPQCFHHPDMKIQQRTGATHQQRGAAETVMCPTEKFEFFLEADLLDLRAGQRRKGVDDLLDIVVNQLFGTEDRTLVEGGLAHPGHIAVNALVEGEQQAAIVVTGAHSPQPVQPDTNRDIVELGGLIAHAPAVHAGGDIEALGRLCPLLVVLGLIHGFGEFTFVPE